MTAKENIKNEESNFQTDALTDLAVTDEQAQQAKGGADSTNPENTTSQRAWFRYDTTNP